MDENDEQDGRQAVCLVDPVDPVNPNHLSIIRTGPPPGGDRKRREW